MDLRSVAAQRIRAAPTSAAAGSAYSDGQAHGFATAEGAGRRARGVARDRPGTDRSERRGRDGGNPGNGETADEGE